MLVCMKHSNRGCLVVNAALGFALCCINHSTLHSCCIFHTHSRQCFNYNIKHIVNVSDWKFIVMSWETDLEGLIKLVTFNRSSSQRIWWYIFTWLNSLQDVACLRYGVVYQPRIHVFFVTEQIFYIIHYLHIINICLSFHTQFMSEQFLQQKLIMMQGRNDMAIILSCKSSEIVNKLPGVSTKPHENAKTRCLIAS